MIASKDRIRITIEGPRDQIQYRMDYWPSGDPFLDTLTISHVYDADVTIEVIKPPEPPKVYTYWERNTAPLVEFTRFRVDEDGQWQIFREDAWQDCIYIRSLEDLAHRAYLLRKAGSE